MIVLLGEIPARHYEYREILAGVIAEKSSAPPVLRRLKPFDMKLHYTDRHRLPESVEKELTLTYHPNVESMVKVCDVVTVTEQAGK